MKAQWVVRKMEASCVGSVGKKKESYGAVYKGWTVLVLPAVE